MNAAIKAYKAQKVQTTKACKAQKAQTAKAYEIQKAQATIATKLAHSHETQIALLGSQNAQIEPLNSHKQQVKPLNSHSSQIKTTNLHEFTGFSSPQAMPNILPQALQTNQSLDNAPSQTQMIDKTAQNLNKISSQTQVAQTLGKANLNNSNNPNKAPSKRQDILYHNDFNAEIFFPANFNELDFNIFYTIFYFLKERKDELVELKFQEIKDLIYEGRKQKENSTLFYKKIPEFINKLSQLQIRTEDLRHKFVCNFFIEVLINKDEKSLCLRVNRNFIYILNNLSENYTKFELKKFLSIKGTYTKNIYRLCIQYKNTGKYIQRDWALFRKQMAIPEQYEMRHIGQKVLKPIIEYFDKNKGFLNNLKYEKIKAKGRGARGRGGATSGICFTWDVEGKK